MAVVSHLAAKNYLKQEKVTLALNLGRGSYVDGHQLIFAVVSKKNPPGWV